MLYEPFYKLFPKIAAKETRILHFLKHEVIPIGDYAFSPSYCADKKCDCRRALIQVYPAAAAGLLDKPLATISYGWEDFQFYRNWSMSLSDEMVTEFKGPTLDRMQPQSPYASHLLEQFVQVIKKDVDYVQRLQRHYAIFKYKKGMRLPIELKRLINPLASCACESGKIFKLCCGKNRSRFGKRKR